MMTEAGTRDQVQELTEAFESFNQGTQTMRQMYGLLEERIEYLTRELDRKSRELEKANRLGALGELAAGVAHEIRNPLGGIELCANMLGRELSGSDDQRELVDTILEGVRRLNGIVGNLLSLARDNTTSMRPVRVSTLIQEAIDSLERTTALNRVEIVMKQSPGSDTVFAEADQLRQVFINLVQNAAEAMPAGGSLTIERDTLTDQECDFLVIRFRDTGIGIDEQNLEKVFQPFFTTKETGTGLGLAISYRIIENHKGRMQVESVKGKGTCFTIFLPASLSRTK